MVADLSVVEDAFVWTHPSGGQRLAGMGCEQGAIDRFQNASRGCEMVFGKVTGIGSGVGERLVLFVESLRDLQGHAGGEAEALVCFALESGQVVEEGSDLGGWFFFLLNRSGFAFAGCTDGFRFLSVPKSLRFCVLLAFAFGEGFVKPTSGIGSGLCLECGVDFEVGLCLERTDFLFPFDENGEGGGLDATGGCFVEPPFSGVEGGEGACAVDSDQPVGFRAAEGCVGEGLKFLI